jgi:extradiol dioxygenase family protein
MNVYKELLSKGVKFLTEPKVINRKEGGSVCICYAQDPEGNWLEFLEEIED